MSLSNFEFRLVCGLGLVLLGFASYLPIVKLHGAYPLAVMWPSSVFKLDLRGAAGFAAAVVFWFSSGLGLRGTSAPVGLALAGLVVTIVSVLYFAMKWSDGLGYQGYAHTTFWAVVNAAAAVVAAVSIILAWSRPAGAAHVFGHFVVVAWVSFVALPFLGEPPAS